MKLKNIISILLSAGIFLTSCEDFFNVNPDDVLLEENYPGSLTELYSGYMGVSAKVQAAADHAVFLEGLRGDFLEPTANATDDIIDIYYYREKSGNAMAGPQKFYEVILNANDYIKHATAFFENNPASIDESQFNGLVAGALRYKSWAYLMLAKIYGQAVWIDDTMVEYKDISNYKIYRFDDLILKCISLIEDGITVRGKIVNGKPSVRWSDPTVANSILNSNDLKWNRYCPPADCLLAELYLFANQYQKALEHGFAMLTIGVEDGAAKPSYQITKSEWNGEWIGLFSDFVRTEAIFLMYYDYDKNQTNNLIEYFSNDPANSYLLRPTQAAMDRFNNQIRLDGSLGDNYRGIDKTFKKVNGEWVVWKYTRGRETSGKIFRNDVPISLYRAVDVHLWIAEALGNLGRMREALTFLNGGISSRYNASTGVYLDEEENGTVIAKYTDFPLSLMGDGKDANISQGVRGRVSMKAMGKEIIDYPSSDINLDKQKLDSLLVEETCLETAGEAKAYYAMIRIAKRWNNPAAVADRVSAKYTDKVNMHNLLLNPENWFIKYDLE
jgi:hypothetical protein